MHNPIAVSADGNYSVEFVECLASCGTAPVCMVGDELHENVDPESAADLVKDGDLQSAHDRHGQNRRSIGMAAASARTPADFQKHRTPRLDDATSIVICATAVTNN